MTNKNNQEAGYTLISVILIFTILSVLGLSLVTLSFTSVKTSNNEHNDQAAFYIAEAGLNYKLNELKKTEIESIYQRNSVKKEDEFYQELRGTDGIIGQETITHIFEKVNNEPPKAAIVTISPLSDHKYDIISKGMIGDQSRTVSTTIDIHWEDKFEVRETDPEPFELPPFAVFTSGNFNMNNGTINGDVGTLSNERDAINISSGGPTVNGDIYVLDGNREYVNQSSNKGNSEVKAIKEDYTIPELPPFPEIPDYTCAKDEVAEVSEWNKYDVIKDCNLRMDNWMVRDSKYVLFMNKNLRFNEMKFTEGYRLKIDLRGSDREIVVNDLNMINGHIELIGSGNLNIYVKDKIKMSSGSKINVKGDSLTKGEPNRVNIFYSGTEDIELTDDEQIYGSLYSKSNLAKLYLTGSGAVHGNIFSNGEEISLSGGSDIVTQLVLAPNATVNMTAGGNLSGRVISKEFNNTGGATVTLDGKLNITGPISLQNDSDTENDNGSSGDNGGELEPIEGASPSISTSPMKEID